MGRFRDAMEDEMRLRDLAVKTQRDYIRAVKRPLNFTRKWPDKTSYEDLRAYLVDLTKREVGFSVYNHAVCTRLFYREVMRRNWPFERLPYRS
ncbi:MAG: phage integrase N-terminal SAM-like domain-containing protein [Vicinamibacteria bacterium]|nr:phage integrase N-terminal SAM-like domain-containing protein [Vicinamibacteria bacterium]